MPRVPPVNPLPRQIGRCGEVLFTGKELCLQSPHPAGACGLPGYGAPADNPVIACRPFLPVRGSRMLMAGHVRQAERVIRLAAGRPSGVGGDSATVEPEIQAAVEIEPKRHINRFTRRVRHMPRPKMRSRHFFL